MPTPKRLRSKLRAAARERKPHKKVTRTDSQLALNLIPSRENFLDASRVPINLKNDAPASSSSAPSKKNSPTNASPAPAVATPLDPFDLNHIEEILNEAALVIFAQRGLVAFGELARRYRAYLLRVATAILRNEDDAEDAVQDSLLVAFSNLRSFDSARGDLQQWLAGIVRKRCKGILRERERTGAISLDQVQHIAHSLDLQALVEERERMTTLARAIQALPNLQRASIELAAMSRTHKEISFALGITPHAVTMNLSRARRTLLDKLNAAGYGT